MYFTERQYEWAAIRRGPNIMHKILCFGLFVTCLGVIWLRLASLEWRHMSVMASEITDHDCACSTLWLESKEHHKSALLALCEGNPQVTSEFLSQRACDVENVSWHHHVVRASEVISWSYPCLETLSTSLALYVGNPPVTSEFPTQRAVIQSLDDVFVVSPIKPLNKQSISRCNETS